MNRISGTLAILAGMALLTCGLFGLLHNGLASAPGWLVRDLACASLSGAALLCWGVLSIRHRELELHDLERVRVRRR